MNLVCCCASEDCRVNGCARWRKLRRDYVTHPFAPSRWETVERGWLCPKCGGVNAPFAPVCFHCKPTTASTGTSTA